MHPIFLKVAPVVIYSYGVALVAGFLLTTWVASRVARTLEPRYQVLNAGEIVDVTCILLIGGIVGGRVFYVLLYWDIFMRYPGEILALWRGGLVWYGGFLGGFLAGWLYARIKRKSFWRGADQMFAFVPLGHAIGRIGCLLNGCCYGKVSTAWCAITLPGHSSRLLPVQLFEAVGLLALYVVLRKLQRPALLDLPGSITGCYLAGYAVLRIVTESMRGDQTPWLGPLTLQQVVSLGLLAGGIVLLLVARARKAT